MGNGAGVARWVGRFDKLILVTAPDEVKVARFVGRAISAMLMTGRTGTPRNLRAGRKSAIGLADTRPGEGRAL